MIIPMRLKLPAFSHVFVENKKAALTSWWTMRIQEQRIFLRHLQKTKNSGNLVLMKHLELDGIASIKLVFGITISARFWVHEWCLSTVTSLANGTNLGKSRTPVLLSTFHLLVVWAITSMLSTVQVSFQKFGAFSVWYYSLVFAYYVMN